MTQEQEPHECWKHEVLDRTYVRKEKAGKIEIPITVYVYKCSKCGAEREA